ncbi:CHAP domain-containing protein [Longispora albida]|uniref:CHAP domain-containing protein n=1 Tax=Longispora albida TaxID=203523 RepID=UPI000369C189|nr:CHAP domain-containing protein [Longispora albida]
MKIRGKRRAKWLIAGVTVLVLLGVAATVALWPISDPATPAAGKVVELAERELANTDRDHEVDGCNYYSGQARGGAAGCPAGWNRGPWCAEFARYLWTNAGVPGAKGIDAWARSGRQYGEKHGTWHPADSGYTPRPGDLVVYRDGAFEVPDGNSDHIGVVTAVHLGWFSTIEGNTTGAVTARRHVPRSWDTIEGFASPAAA